MTDPADFRLYGICLFGAGGLAAGAIGLCAGRFPPPVRRMTLFVVAIALAVVAGGLYLFGHVRDLVQPILALDGVLLLLAAARSEHVARGVAALIVRVRSPRWQWSALAVVCPAVAGALLLQSPAPQLEPVKSSDSPPAVLIPPLRMLPVNSAVTDAGNDLTLWATEVPIPSGEDLTAAETRELRRQGLLTGVIRTALPDRSYNCHGWIFTRNHCYIPDWAVDSILKDNGYMAVDFPAAGDLVVYRNDLGVAFHTAQVWAIGDDGQILLESKWGWMGRYLHRPEQSPYGSKWTFYHSRRHGHVLRNQLDSLPQTSKSGRD